MGEPILQAAMIPTTLPGGPVVDADLNVVDCTALPDAERDLRFHGQPALRHVRR